MNSKKIILLSVIFTALFSCRKETQVKNEIPEIPKQEIVLPQTTKEKQTVAIINDVAKILEIIYQDPKVYFEVDAAIYSEYYNDERVLLKDLLFPESSELYKTQKFKKLGVSAGFFKKAFFETLNAGEYPDLKKALEVTLYSFNKNSIHSIDLPAPTDTAAEIFSNSAGVSIYFPYSENFGSKFTASYFDNINKPPYRYTATIVSAQADADSGPGREPYICGTRTDQKLCWKNVTVNDSYAEIFETHIVGVGAEPARPATPPPPPPSSNINRVFHGWSRINGTQLDKLISFTGNGGGSEMKIARISGYLQFTNQQVTGFTGDVVSVEYTRKEIRKKRWKRIYSVWDADWVPDNLEQTYAVWEDDTQGSKTLTGSLATTLQIPDTTPPSTVTGSIGYSVTVQTQDEIITQRKITRIAYFGAAKADQACGFQMSDDKGSRYDNTFLTTGYWPIYDCGTTWGYTWPYNSY